LRRPRAALIVTGGLLLLGCSAPRVHATPRASEAPPQVDPTTPKLESLLSRRPDLVLTLHPRALAHDPVYGPLLRRASELASAYAGPTNLGTTALAALERTDDVVVAENDSGKEAVVVLRGVPGDLDPLDVVDPSGHPIWRPVHGDIRAGSRELAPAEPADAELFVAPGLVWLIASGPVIPRVRAALTGAVGAQAFAGDDTPLLSISLPGDALPRLREGALASVGAGLHRVRVELTPGSTGLIIGTLAYADAVTAATAEGTVLAVTLAFRHRLEADVEAAEAGPQAGAGGAGEAGAHRRDDRPLRNLDWLGAAKVERTGPLVVVRAPIPRPWLEALARADVPSPGP